LGGLLLEIGDYPLARTVLTECLELRRRSGDSRPLAAAIIVFAELERRTGNLSEAQSLGNEGLGRARSVGDDTLIATALNNLGFVASARGDHATATSFLVEALRIFHMLGNRAVEAECCHRLAQVASVRGRPSLAARLLGASDVLRETSGTVLAPDERLTYERTVATVRAAAGENAYATAWHDGYSASLTDLMGALGTDTDLQEAASESAPLLRS
jgi:tetratricopeptide (TPR) repeat protein